MEPIFFAPTVLQRYATDPHYYFRFHDFGGTLGTEDEFYLSEASPAEDKVLVQTVWNGMGGWSSSQAIAVYLVYLSGLSERHQSHWRGSELADQARYKLDRDYVRTSLFGDWPAHPSVVEAIFGEQRAINELLAAIGRPRLFSEEFNAGDRPRGLQPFLLPTREEMERFTLQLDQVLSENLDARFFAGEVDTYEDISIGGDRIQRVQKRTIRLLREWLEKRYPTQPELVALITKPMAKNKRNETAASA